MSHDHLDRFAAKVSLLTTARLKDLRNMVYVDRGVLSYEQGRILDLLILERKRAEGDDHLEDSKDTAPEGENTPQTIHGKEDLCHR